MLRPHIVLVSVDEIHLHGLKNALDETQDFHVTLCPIGSIPPQKQVKHVMRFCTKIIAADDSIQVLVVDECGADISLLLSLSNLFKSISNLKLGCILTNITPAKLSLIIDNHYQMIVAVEDPLLSEFPRKIYNVLRGRDRFAFSEATTNAFVELSMIKMALQNVTKHQLAVLLLLIDGYDVDKIATVLNIPRNGVYQHLHRIRKRFGASSTNQLVEMVTAALPPTLVSSDILTRFNVVLSAGDDGIPHKL